MLSKCILLVEILFVNSAFFDELKEYAILLAFSTARSSTIILVGFVLAELLEGIAVLISFDNFLGFRSAMAK